ncbi:hypothetical protein RQP46_002658 [Phenoliferia psychrophenolica]
MTPLLPFTPSRKRRVIEQEDDHDHSDAPPPTPPRLIKRSQRILPSFKRAGECGKLVTVDPIRGRVELIIQDRCVFKIGRDPSNDYSIPKADVSAFHSQLHALKSDTGETFVCFEDLSRNGSMWNDRAVHHATVVLSSGDRVEIGGQGFTWQQQDGPSSSKTKERDVRTVERIGEYVVFDRTLGSGAFSVVHLAFNTHSMKQIACKKIRKRRLRASEVANVQREVAILKVLQHPNINAVENVCWREDEIVPGGDLFSYLAKHHTLPAPECKFILYQLFNALDYLHRTMNISHRDLKLENIIVSGSGPFPKVLLADFGAARVADTAFSSITGTLVYLSPEALTAWTRREGYDGKLLDMWSLGIVFFMLLLGYHPFEKSNPSQLGSFESSLLGSAMDHLDEHRDAKTCAHVCHGDLYLPDDVTFGSDDASARALLIHLLQPDPKKRCTAQQGLSSKWIEGSRNELRALYDRVVLGRFA